MHVNGGVALVRLVGGISEVTLHSNHASSFKTANATFECRRLNVYPSSPGKSAEMFLHSFRQKMVVSIAFIVFSSTDDWLMDSGFQTTDLPYIR